MLRLVQVVLALATAFCFGWWVGVVHLALVLQPLTIALSIFTAAVLVRLARGMPTLDWKSIPPESRKRLTSELVLIAWEYAGLLFLLSMLLVSAIALLGFGEEAARRPSAWGFEFVPAFFGLLIGLVTLRMAYVVWRDLDIIRLQKNVIDAMADEEELGANVSAATQKIEAMKAAQRRGAAVPEPEEWRG